MKYSYHNHTPLCKHSTGSMEDFVLAAIKGGYDVFGFSDHCPHTFKYNDFIGSSRMTADELSYYVKSIRALREKYGNKIDIRIGLETEYLPYHHEKNMQLFRSAGVEYLILGQHMLGGNDDSYSFINSFCPTDYNEVLRTYTNQVIDGMRTGDFCYLAHPDVLRYQGDDDFYRSESDRLIKEAMRLDIPLEVNMYGLRDGRHYPNPLFWERVGRLGAKVVIGRDAHSTDRVDPTVEYEAAHAFVKKHGLNVLDEFYVTVSL